VQTLWSAVSPWIPLLIVLVFWVFFLTKMRASKYGRLIDRNFEHMDRVESLLENILDELRSRPRT
jgi:hypothetical protein